MLQGAPLKSIIRRAGDLTKLWGSTLADHPVGPKYFSSGVDLESIFSLLSVTVVFLVPKGGGPLVARLPESNLSFDVLFLTIDISSCGFSPLSSPNLHLSSSVISKVTKIELDRRKWAFRDSIVAAC